MDGEKVKMGVALAACLAVLVQMSSAATSLVVGGSTGWTIPSSTSFYSSWASKETFLVGDFLVFNFPSGAHTVAEVTKSDYDSCATTSPISQLNNGPANLTISSAGTHYYICTIVGHCSGGQKLAITASAAASTAAPTPKSTPSRSPTTAPSPKSATTPTASPTPKSSPAAPTPSSTTAPSPSSRAPTPATSASSPTPASSPTAASAPGPSAAGSPESAAPGQSASGSPETAPAPSTGSGPSSSPSAVAGGPPAPPTSPTGAPASTPGSDSADAGAGLVLSLLAIIGAHFLC